MSVSTKEIHSHTRYAHKRFRFAAGYVVVLKELSTKLDLLKTSRNFALHRTNDVMTFRVECDITHFLVYWPGGFFVYASVLFLPFFRTMGHQHHSLALYPHLLSSCSMFATAKATEDVTAPVCFGVHAVHKYDI